MSDKAEARVPGSAVDGAAPKEAALLGRERRAPSLRPQGPAERQLLPPRRESPLGLTPTSRRHRAGRWV